MKNTKIIIGIIIVVVLAGILLKSKSPDGSIKIGLISPITGLVANGDNLGQGFANGATLAKEEFEKKNGKLKVNMIIEDDGFDSKKGLSAYQKLVSVDNVDSLINLSSPTIDVIKTAVHERGFPVLQLGAESEISKDNIFQMYPDQTSVGMLGEVANKDGVKTVTVVMEQVKAYEKFISDFQKSFSGTTAIIRIPTTEKDYSSTALKIKQLNSDAVLIFTSSVVGSQVLAKVQTIGYKIPKIYFDLGLQLGLKEYKNLLGSTMPMLENSKALYSLTKDAPSFSTAYKARFNADPSVLSAYGYDSFNAMVSTYNADKTQWLNNIQKYNAEGATGKISFDAVGLRPPEFTIATVKSGELKMQ